jgi:hypothetical protein
MSSSTSSSRRRITITIVVVVTILMLAAAPTSLFYKVANAAPNKILQGSGTGTVTCPNGSTVDNVQVQSFVQRQGKSTGGFFSIRDPATGNEKPSNIFQGQINSNQYKLQGIENFDGICGASTPTTISVSGTCGIGGTGQFTADNGERVTFSGNFACSA